MSEAAAWGERPFGMGVEVLVWVTDAHTAVKGSAPLKYLPGRNVLEERLLCSAHLVPGLMWRLGSRPFVRRRAAGQTTISLLFGAHLAWEPCCYFYPGGAPHSWFGGRRALGSD